MAILDGFVNALFQFRADGVVLESGQPALLQTGNDRRSITAQAPTHEQLLKIVGEVAPPESLDKITANRHTSFQYQSPAGRVAITAFTESGLLRVHVLPANRPAPPEPETLLEVVFDEEPEPAVVKGTTSANGRPAAAAATATASAPAAAAAPAPVAAAAPAPVVAVAASPRAGAPAIEALFMTMVRERCSDLHLCSGNPPLFRKDGDIVNLGVAHALTPEKAGAMLREIMPARNREEYDGHHDTDFAYEIPGVARFRCNVFLDRKGPGGVFRIIPAQIVGAEDLGLSKSLLELCELPKGLVLVTGPTGSGKSTTLAAMIDYINRRKNAHIITIEDPIEFVHENKKCLVNQREVGPHTDGFKAALRAALREDPDIVLVGELRDLETVAIAIETAETGHLVFGTLHTNTAASTVDRMIDQFPMGQQAQIRTMLSESLKGVVSQTLCKKKGGGRVAAQEILIVASSVANLIRDGKTFQITSIMQAGKGLGMVTMNDALLELVKKKLVDPDEAYAKSTAKAELKSALVKIGQPPVEA